MSQTARLTPYPPEKSYFKWGLSSSLGVHLAVIGLVALVAFLTNVKSIEELMAEGGSIAQSGPAPEENIEVTLQPEELPPPPPITEPEFVRQVELPKPVVEPPPPVPVIPAPKPIVIKKPKFTAPKATGTGESAAVSRLVVGSSGFPSPGYPYEAQVRRQTGTVVVSIQFDASGSVRDVDVVRSSGSSSLDLNSRSFIRAHWRNESFAGRRATVPIVYQLN